MNFNGSRERRNVLVSILILGFLFSIISLEYSITFLLSLPSYIIGVAIAICVNTIVSRLIAERFGCVFIFKFWLPGLIMGIISSIISMGSVVFAAPASKAVEPKRIERWEKKHIHMSNKEIGIVSLVGPLTNFLLAVLFWVFANATGFEFLFTFTFINLWVSLSHLIPYHPLDGARVMVWDDLIWLLSFILPALGLLLYFL